MRTAAAPLKAKATGDPGDSVFRVKVPGYGWRKLRYPTLREKLARNRAPYVILTGSERASVTLPAGVM